MQGVEGSTYVVSWRRVTARCARLTAGVCGGDELGVCIYLYISCRNDHSNVYTLDDGALHMLGDATVSSYDTDASSLCFCSLIAVPAA